MAIRTLIVDDEPLARDRVLRFLRQQEDLDIIGQCGSGRDALARIAADDPDLVFLDVQMPEMDGFGVIEGLNGRPKPAFVFMTAYDQLALRAFEAFAADYLIKPVDHERILETLQRVRDEKEPRGQVNNDRLVSLLAEYRQRRRCAERFAVRTDGRIIFIKTEDIEWIEAAGNYIRLHMNKQTHMMRGTISGIEQRLDPARFLRVHRSAIVNLDFVEEIQPWFHGEYVIIMSSGARVNLSRSYRQRMQELVDVLS